MEFKIRLQSGWSWWCLLQLSSTDWWYSRDDNSSPSAPLITYCCECTWVGEEVVIISSSVWRRAPLQPQCNVVDEGIPAVVRWQRFPYLVLHVLDVQHLIQMNCRPPAEVGESVEACPPGVSSHSLYSLYRYIYSHYNYRIYLVWILIKLYLQVSAVGIKNPAASCLRLFSYMRARI